LLHQGILVPLPSAAGMGTATGGAIIVAKPSLELRRLLVRRFRSQVCGQLALFGPRRSRSSASEVLLG
jgi:hypothetical protein